jgi:hypothetical protein
MRGALLLHNDGEDDDAAAAAHGDDTKDNGKPLSVSSDWFVTNHTTLIKQNRHKLTAS